MLIFNPEIYDEQKQIKYLKMSINNIVEFLRGNKNDLENHYALKNGFYNAMKKILEDLIENSNIRVSLNKLYSVEFLANNISELEKIYNQIIKEEQETGLNVSEDDGLYLSINIEENKKKVVKECVALIRNDLDELNGFSDKTLLPIVSQKSKKERDSILKEIEEDYGKEARKTMEDMIKIYRTPEVDLLKEQMKHVSKAYKDTVRTYYMKSLKFIGDFLNEFDLMKSYVKSSNKNLRKVGIKQFEYSEEDVKKIFTEEYLNQLSIEQLSYMNVFWINRFSKEMENISKTAFIITDLDLWKDIFEDNNIKISDDELKWELLKIETLSDFSMGCFVMSEDNFVLKDAIEKAKEDDEEMKRMKEKGSMKLDFSKHIDQTQEKYGKKYHDIYSKHLPKSNNNFTHDLDYFKNVYNSTQNAYILKDIALDGILNNLQLNSNIENWGVMKQAKRDRILKGKYLLIGVDLVGMNMPVRLHIPRELVLENARENSRQNVVPIYSGTEDFQLAGDWISSPILMLAPEKLKENLKLEIESSKISIHKNGLYPHLAYVAGMQGIPEHLLKQRNITKKGKKIVKKEYIREYIDINTGEIIDENQLKQRDAKGDEEK